MKTLKQTVDRVLRRLESYDSVGVDNAAWTRSEVSDYVEAAYNKLCRDVPCIWDMTFVAENQPYCANHTAKWEEAYFSSGWLIGSIFTYTGGGSSASEPSPPSWEIQYLNNQIGPADHTNYWEHNLTYTVADDSYTFQDIFAPVVQLPESNISVDRATYDDYIINPVYSRDLAEHYQYYEYVQGPQRSFVLDKDGYFSFRKVPAPSGRATTYSFTDTADNSATFGSLRRQTDEELEIDPDVQGARGTLRVAPGHFPSGRRGIIKGVYSDAMNVRVEHFRRGNDLERFEFEIPDRFVKYVELFAMSLARERDGNGQSKKISQHYLQRYQIGVERLRKRMRTVLRERTSHMGSGGRTDQWPQLARLPWQFPAVDRRGSY